MSAAQWWLLGAAAVLIFWMVGGYNRMMALRNAIGAAVAQLDEGLARRAAAAEPLIAALRQPLADEQGALDALLTALLGVQAAAARLRAKPAALEAAAAFTHAEAQWQSAFSRVKSLVEQQLPLMQDMAIAQPLQSLRDADMRVAFARQLFNDGAVTHDEALAQFPTSLLARIFSLRAAGRL